MHYHAISHLLLVLFLLPFDCCICYPNTAGHCMTSLIGCGSCWFHSLHGENCQPHWHHCPIMLFPIACASTSQAVTHWKDSSLFVFVDLILCRVMNFLIVKLCFILACYFCCHSCQAMLFGMKLCYFIFLREFAPVPLVLRTSSSFSPVLKGDTEILCNILVHHLLCDTWTSASHSTPSQLYDKVAYKCFLN